MSVDEDAAAGALLGTFAGDALGMPFEGASPERIRDEHGRITRMGEARAGKGTYTDDTQTMIALAESLIAEERVDPQALARTLVDHHDPARGYGQGTTRVFRMLNEGVPVEEAAARVFDGGSYGNGGAMRTAPVPVAYAGRPDEMDCATRAACRVTHAHPLGIQGALVQAHAIDWALGRDPGQADGVGLVRAALSSLDEALDDGRYRDRLEDAARLLEAGAPLDPVKAARHLGNDSRAFASVPAAVYAAAAHAGSFQAAVSYAVSLGGDTDTVGAMAGAISGALHGASGIPEAWMDVLEEGPKGREHVRSLGVKVARLDPDPPGPR